MGFLDCRQTGILTPRLASLLCPARKGLVVDPHHLGKRGSGHSALFKLIQNCLSSLRAHLHPTQHIPLQYLGLWQIRSHRCRSLSPTTFMTTAVQRCPVYRLPFKAFSLVALLHRSATFSRNFLPVYDGFGSNFACFMTPIMESATMSIKCCTGGPPATRLLVLTCHGTCRDFFPLNAHHLDS